jgi:hypothetical protein
MADEEKPPFDPSQPFTVDKPPFDPSRPFETVDTAPKAGLLGNIYEAGHSAVSGLNATLNPFSEAVRARHEAESKLPFFSMPESFMATGRGLTAIPELAASPITGTVKTAAPYLADLEAKAVQAIGEPIARGISYLRGKEPAPMPSREQISRDIEPQMETALGLLSPRAGMPTAGGAFRPSVPPPPAPPPRPAPSTGPFGVTLSEGQAVGDLSTIQREQAALRGTSGKPAQQAAAKFATQQEAELAAAKGDIAKSLDTLGGQIIAAGPQEAGEVVSAGVKSAAKTAKTDVTQAYETARGLPGEIHAGAFEGIGQGIKGDLSLGTEPVIIDERLTPHAAHMIDDLEKRISQLRIQNRADPFGQPNPENIVGVNLAGVDQMRKRLSSMRRDAYASGNAADGRAAQAVIDAFDERINAAVNGGQFTGDARAVGAWNDARAAYADYKSIFSKGKSDPVGGAVEKILGKGNTPAAHGNDVADFIYGRSGVNPNTRDVAVAQRIKSILGEQSPEWIGARQGLFSRLTETPPGVTDWGPGKVANRINQFLNGDGKELARVVFSQQERAMLQRYADLMRQLEVPQAGANWSNTATFLQKIGNKVTSNTAAVIGGFLGHGLGLPYVGELAGMAVGKGAAQVVGKIGEAKEARAISGLMPTVTNQLKQWQQAVRRAQSNTTPSTRAAVTLASTNLARSLKQMGITAIEAPTPAGAEQQQVEVPRPPAEQHDGGAVENEQGFRRGGHVVPLRQHGGRVNAENIEKNPTEGQKTANNYAKDHVHIFGLDLTIENAKGHERSGIDKDGKKWSVRMPCAYGYIKGTEGKDRDHVDVYLGTHLKSPKAFVIDQKNAETGRFDEHKTFLCFASEVQVRTCYAKAFSDGKAHLRLGHIEEMTVEQFKHWLENGDTTKPIKNGEDKKLPHSSVGYVATSPHAGKYCGVCSMFVTDGPHCTLVADPVRAAGYCKRFFKGKPHAN